MMYRYILGYYYNCTRAGLGLSNAEVMAGILIPLLCLCPLLYLCPSINLPFLPHSCSDPYRVSLDQLVILQCVHLIVS
jgi:hypothetical protein